MFSISWHGKPLTPIRLLRAIEVRVRDRIQPVNEVRGVYASFLEAAAAAPKTKPLGYDAANAGSWYGDKLEGVKLEDYPILFWLAGALRGSRSILEIGGHVGVAYYGFSRYLEYDPDLVWTILDVPSVMEAGELLAKERGSRHLRFAHGGLQGISGADILLAVGALQYLAEDVSALVSDLEHAPRHILINVTPVYDGPSFVTIQNVGSVYCAYRVFNREALVGSLESIGYRLVDTWKQPRRFRVPGHPDRAFDHYSGFYFRAMPE